MKHTIYPFVILSVVLLGCTIVDGDKENLTNTGFRPCTTAAECGLGRFCGDQGFCTAQCGSSLDCYYFDEDAKAAYLAAKAAGIPFSEADMPDPKFHCSSCGTCIPIEQEEDERCPASGLVYCTADDDCGTSMVCGSAGVCTSVCETDDNCTQLGSGHRCATQGDRKECIKWCYNDSSCAYHGYGWECELPTGTDPEENFYDETPEIGYCKPREGGVDYGDRPGANAEADKWTGVYGLLLETAFTNCGLPLIDCQNSTNIHHFLVRVRPTENGVEMHAKYCKHQMRNFTTSDVNPTYDEYWDVDTLSWMEVPILYSMSLPLNYYAAGVDGEVKVGSTFETSVYREVRGAILDDWENDPLPDADIYEDTCLPWENHLSLPGCHVFDQDRDGFPGMTNVMVGTFTGEVYHTVRFHQSMAGQVVLVDNEGRVMKFKGLMTNDSEQYLLGASDPQLLQQTTSAIHQNPQRSYFRGMRVAESTTCQDIIDIGLSEKNCNSDINLIKITVDDDDTWLCHTGTIDGPVGTPPPDYQ